MLLTEAVVVEGHVLLLLRLARYVHRGRRVGRLLRRRLEGLLLVEVGLGRVLRVLMLLLLLKWLAGIGRLPRGQPAAVGHDGGIMSMRERRWRCRGKAPLSSLGSNVPLRLDDGSDAVLVRIARAVSSVYRSESRVLMAGGRLEVGSTCDHVFYEAGVELKFDKRGLASSPVDWVDWSAGTNDQAHHFLTRRKVSR